MQRPVAIQIGNSMKISIKNIFLFALLASLIGVGAQFVVSKTFFDDLQSKSVKAFVRSNVVLIKTVGRIDNVEVVRRTTVPNDQAVEVENFVLRVNGDVKDVLVTIRVTSRSGKDTYEIVEIE